MDPPPYDERTCHSSNLLALLPPSVPTTTMPPVLA
jgi:hypothetical protein